MEARHLLRNLLCHVALIERETRLIHTHTPTHTHTDTLIYTNTSAGGKFERVLTEWDTHTHRHRHRDKDMDMAHNSFVYASTIYRNVQLLKQIWIATKKQRGSHCCFASHAILLSQCAPSFALALAISCLITEKSSKLNICSMCSPLRSHLKRFLPIWLVCCFVKHLNWLQLKSMLQQNANSQPTALYTPPHSQWVGHSYLFIFLNVAQPKN